MSSSSKDHLTEAGRFARNYGTVTAQVGPGYIEHTVEKTDTLQGIALKYGTTVRTRPTAPPKRLCYKHRLLLLRT